MKKLDPRNTPILIVYDYDSHLRRHIENKGQDNKISTANTPYTIIYW